jgi:hypothetical protein
VRRALLMLAILLCGCPATPEQRNRPAAPPPPGTIQHFGDEDRVQPGSGTCSELDWAPPDYPPAYKNPGCHNSAEYRCPRGTVCCSYRCVKGCVAATDVGCADYPTCVEEAQCRPGGRVATDETR